MELKSFNCPNCGGSLEIEDGLDTFFCKYCGHQIMMTGQSDVAYKAKVQIKAMEHRERILDKRDAQKRYKMEAKQKEEKRAVLIVFACFSAVLSICLLIVLFGNVGVKRQEKELQAIVDEILIDIENEDFAEAYVKANSLYWDDSYTSDGEEKWDAIREEIINQIEEAEEKATGSISNSTN